MSFENVIRSHQDIKTLARSFLGRPAFDELYVLLPDPESPESAFLRATSWLYCLYFEAGRISLNFLQRLGEAYSLVERVAADKHVETVRCLRTELHHNLGFAESDMAARSMAEGWRRRVCGTALPRSADQWRSCYDSIVEEACVFLSTIDNVVRRIESEGAEAQHHIDEWLRRLNRSWVGAAFDPLINDAKYRLAREALNTVAFRNRHLEKWRKQLDLLDDGFDFEFEASRLIEKAMLDDDSVVLPITGKDVIDVVGVPPGREVGLFLEEARRHFEINKSTKEALLDHLKVYKERMSAEGGGTA